MKTKLIQTKDYLLLIDEEAICKTEELYLTSIQNRIIPKSKGVIQAGDKIIAYRKLNSEAKELDLPLLPNPFEIDIENIADEYVKIHNLFNTTYIKNAFMRGYKAAQPKQYSLEDVKKAFEAGREYQSTFTHKDAPDLEGYIQSLSTQQLPNEFIPEYEDYNPYDPRSKTGKHESKDEVGIKTIINSEGKQELVGTYKY